MSEKPNKPNPDKLKLRKTVVKDMPLRSGKAGKVKGGKNTCGGTTCAKTVTYGCFGAFITSV